MTPFRRNFVTYVTHVTYVTIQSYHAQNQWNSE